MSMPPIRVALLGYGLAGRIFHAPFITATPGLELAVVATRQAPLVAESYPGVAVVAEPLAAVERDGIDLVVIATPNDTHVPLAAAALRAGRHVVVDKPFTITHAESRTLADVAAASGRLLSVFQNRRWDGDFLGVQQALRDGAIGDVVEFRSEFSRWRPLVRDRWRERPGPGAGMWFDLGPHLVDQALVLFGVPDAVSASLRLMRDGAAAVDWFHVGLEYQRRQVLLTSSMLAAEAAPRFLVRGTAGSLIKRGGDVQEAALLDGARPDADTWGRDDDPLEIVRPDADPVSHQVPPGDYRRYYAAMRDAIRGDGQVPVTPAQAMALMRVIEAGLLSSDEGRTVRPAFDDDERAAFDTSR